MKKLVFILSVVSVGFMACKEEGGNKLKTASNKNYSNVTVDTDSESEKFSYSIGMIIGSTLKNNSVDSIDYSVIDRAFDDSEKDQIAYTLTSREVQNLLGEEVNVESIDQDILKRAIYDVLEGDTTLLTMPEVNTSYRTFLQNNQTKIGEKNLQAGKTFLESNKNNEGVQVSDSGLQYQLIEEGTGEMPGNTDVLEVDFTGTTIDGEEFLSTPDEQPAYVDLADNQSEIQGLMEGLTLFPAGSHFKLFIPSNLAFGANRMSPEVGPNSTVVIEVNDFQIMDSEKKAEYKRQKEEYMKQLEQMQRQQQR